jgi:hypothetical protein
MRQSSTNTWGATLTERRRLHFIGRSTELERLFALRDSAGTTPQVVAIVGVEGVGKTLLARRFYDDVQARGGVAYWLSAGEHRSPDALQAALAAQGLTDFSDLGHGVAPDVLVVDAIESLQPAPTWLFERALAMAGRRLCVVVTSRQRLPPRLRSELGITELPLSGLSAAETSALLRRSQIDEALHAELCAFSHGHPLTLVLLVEHLRDRPPESTDPASLAELFARLAEPASQPALDELGFAEAVKTALPRLHRAHELKHSPLVTSALLAASLPPANRVDPTVNTLRAAEALVALLREVCSTLAASPAYASAARILCATFLEPATKQEAAAAALRLPYGTYRYQLRAAIRLLTQELWERECAARAARDRGAAPSSRRRLNSE